MRKNEYNYFDDDIDVIEEEKEFSVESVFEKAKIEAAKIRAKDGKKYLAKVRLGTGTTVVLILVLAIIISSITMTLKLNSNTKSETMFSNDAGKIVTSIIGDYGSCKCEQYKTESGTRYRMIGLSYARKIDFNNDNTAELLVAYNDNDVYAIEVWGYSGSDFAKLYSTEANTYEDLGSWITLYHDNQKIYFGELQEDGEAINLLSFNGKKFKEHKTCKYDIANDLYVIDDKIIADSFETIRFSNLSSTKAELIIEEVNGTIAILNTKTEQEIDAEKTDLERKYDAYYDIIEDCNKEYGKADCVIEDGICYATGLCSVDLIDFNGDGNDELFIVYRFDKKFAGEDSEGDFRLESIPTYKMEIYTWDGTNANKILENDEISSMQGDSDTQFYILEHNESKTNYCRNTYEVDDRYPRREWVGTSKVLEMNEDKVFEAIYTSSLEYDGGYEDYELDGEWARKSKFQEEGYRVPYFCNEDTYDYAKYTIVYVQGETSKESKIKDGIEQSKRTITQINPSYKG